MPTSAIQQLASETAATILETCKQPNKLVEGDFLVKEPITNGKRTLLQKNAGQDRMVSANAKSLVPYQHRSASSFQADEEPLRAERCRYGTRDLAAERWDQTHSMDSGFLESPRCLSEKVRFCRARRVHSLRIQL